MGLINDLLDLNQLQSGRLKIDKTEFNLIDFLDNVLFLLGIQVSLR